MTALSPRELVWNRACFGEQGELRAGDRALAALLRFHNIAMNGGVFHAVECLGSDAGTLPAACDGFRFFRLADVAALIESAQAVPEADLEKLEQVFDARYVQLADAAIELAFKADFAANPDNYAPPADHSARG